MVTEGCMKVDGGDLSLCKALALANADPTSADTNEQPHLSSPI